MKKVERFSPAMFGMVEHWCKSSDVDKIEEALADRDKRLRQLLKNAPTGAIKGDIMTNGERSIWAAAYNQEISKYAISKLRKFGNEAQLNAIAVADARVILLRKTLGDRFNTTDLRGKSRLGRSFAYQMLEMREDYYSPREARDQVKGRENHGQSQEVPQVQDENQKA